MKNFNEKIIFKNLSEKECIEKLNEALKDFVEADCSGGEIVYIAVSVEAGKKLFNEVFEGVTYKEYEKCFEIDETWNGEACDIALMLSYMNLSENVYFNSKEKKFIKYIDTITNIQQARAIIENVGELHQREVVNMLRTLTYNQKDTEYERQAQKVIENMEHEYVLNVANVLWEDKFDDIPDYIKNYS